MGYLFTSESVSEGHPDKLCDQISDSVLDAALAQDPESRVAIETFATKGMVIVAGEMTTRANIDIEGIIRGTLESVGYTDPEYGIGAESCAVLVSIHEQSPDIAQGVDEGAGLHKEQGAGDQGLMFGYATNQTESYMPLPIDLSHALMRELARLRKEGVLPYLRPDSKAQVTVEYDDEEQPIRVDTVVVSTQHDPDVSHSQIEKDVIEQVVKKVIPAKFLDNNTRYIINPTGRFVLGGPHADTGLTGRKIIVDTYGGWIPHGGGAFSGKDASKVDRSAAYMARYIAKNVVAAGMADQLEIQLAYAIGYNEPVSIRVNSFGTAKLPDKEILKVIQSVFDLTPSGIVKALNLKMPIFGPTASYGHFGRTDIALPWEQCDKVEILQKQLKLSTTA